MILFLRKNFHHKGVLQGLLLVTAISMIGIGSVPMLFKIFWSDSRTLFTVNGISVTRSELALKTYGEQQLLTFYKKQFGDLTSQVLAMQGLSLNPEVNAQEKIIRDLVLASAVERSHLSISQDGLLSQIKNPMVVMGILGPQLSHGLYSKQGILQKQALGILLQRVGLTVADFERMLEHEAEKMLALDLARFAVPVLGGEVERQLVKDLARRTYSIAGYSLKPYLAAARAEECSAEELEEYHKTANAREKRYWTPEKRSGKVWSCKVGQEKVEACRKDFQSSLSHDELFGQMLKKWKCTENTLSLVEQTGKHSAVPMLFRLEPDTRGIFVDDGSVFVVMPTMTIAAQEQPLDSVRPRVVEDYYREKAQRLASKDLEEGTLDQANKLSTQEITCAAGQEPDGELLNRLKKIHVPFERLQNMTKKGLVFRSIVADAAYVVTLTDIVMPVPTPKDLFLARKAVRADIESSFLSSFIENLGRTAKIKSIQPINLADIPG